MSPSSDFCLQQRQQERRKQRMFLGISFTISVLVHGLLALAYPYWQIKSPKVKEKPIELIIVEKPKPKPKPPESKIVPKPIPKPEPVKTVTPPPPVKQPEPVKTVTPPLPVKQPELVKTVTPPPPVKQPEPVKTVTPSPPVKQPEPVKPQSTPPKPATKRVLTSPTPEPSQPVISGAIADTSQTLPLNSIFGAESSTNPGAADQGSSLGMPGAVAINNSGAPPRPKPNANEIISCVSNCEPKYPSVLKGVEGSAGIQIMVDAKGNVTNANLTRASSNNELNRQALLAARKMKFSAPSSGSTTSVKVTINFTVSGSDFARQARQEQLERERLAKELQEQEEARQRQLEAERQARQEQLERERQARQQQEIQPEPKPLPAEIKLEPQPLPTSSPEEND